MFYSQFILAKKGPLGTIWIAAHLERKLRKNQVADTDIGISVDSILFPEVPIALRLSSHLLLGVVRIYSRKVNYLFDDCSEALLKIKQAFRSTAVDLPPEESTAPYHSITLPETFDLDDFELPDNEIFQGNYVDHHVSSREQITLQDTMDGVVYSTSQFGLDERFGDGDTSQIGLDLDEELFLEKDTASGDNEVSKSDPQGSDETMTIIKNDASNLEAMPINDDGDQIEGLHANSEFFEYAHAPATPGLVEVPNLSSVQEALASDDHIESADQDLTKPAAAENVESPSCSNITYDTVDAGPRTTSNSNFMPTSECFSENDQVTVNKPADHNDAETTKNSNTYCPLESPYRPTVVDDETQACLEPKDTVQEEVSSAHMHALRPCTSCYDQPDMPSLGEYLEFLPNRQNEVAEQGEGCQNVPELVLCEEIKGDDRNSGKQRDSLISFDDQWENSNDHATSDLPAPEKLLSVPEGITDKPTNLLVESTPDRETLIGTDGIGAGTKPVSGKKRNYTESTLTVESINSVESFGQTRPKRTADSIPDDDDLLSSILVGRKSSVWKMKPTPEVASAKRAQSASRRSASKRKVLMDDAMVLHGDTIRQQLTDTEDIRRARKKAPCTRPEISMIQRQFLEDEIFSKPIFTGMSTELASLHSETYDLSGTRISEVDESYAPPEVAKDPEFSIRPDIANESGIEETVHGDDIEAQPVGTAQTESQQRETPNIDTEHINDAAGPSEPLQWEPLNEMAEMEIDKGPAEVADGENIVAVESATKERDKFLGEEINASTFVEINTDIHPTENGNDSLATSYVETGGFLNGDQAADEVRINEVGEVNGDLVKDADMEVDDKDPTHICNEEPKMDSIYSIELDTAIRSSSNDGEKPAMNEVDAVDAEIIAQDHCNVDNQESGNFVIANDTEFLNVDDELGEEDEDGMPYGDETGILDNSGWSARTRAVAKYLQNLFDNEAVHGRKVLAMDSLLAGKTRKEAARMFFETLVLKTKDYIHVEQPRALDNIGIKPRAKLMKSDF
ncbi:hypothetical protein SLEP1_g38022 [Rubroshorea leprosula]|uniref:Sister chromatid cohesion 1 protein 4-like n=1 Tax=Rubroshorea leprosula TaxID=152421 RepID=A0AAV5KWM6_9ROSI|nr:hypothetical protein SLEP1_g38022 [Rubroshorea leprosula]